MMCGGFTGDKQPDAQVHDLVKKHEDQILAKAGANFGEHKDDQSHKKDHVHHDEHKLEHHSHGIHDQHKSPIKVLSYQTQVVAGTNYKICVEIHGKKYNVTIYEKLPCYGGETEVTEVTAHH